MISEGLSARFCTVRPNIGQSPAAAGCDRAVAASSAQPHPLNIVLVIDRDPLFGSVIPICRVGTPLTGVGRLYSIARLAAAIACASQQDIRSPRPTWVLGRALSVLRRRLNHSAAWRISSRLSPPT